MNEQDFRSLLLLALSAPEYAHCWQVHKQNAGLIRFNDKGTERAFHAGPPPGASDISGIVKPDGWRIEIECKSFDKGGRLGTRSKAQRQWAEHIITNGGVYLLATEKMGIKECVSQLGIAVWRRRGRLPLELGA